MLPILVDSRILEICRDTGFAPDHEIIQITRYALTHCSGCYKRYWSILEVIGDSGVDLQDALIALRQWNCEDVDASRTIRQPDLVKYAHYWLIRCLNCDWLFVCLDNESMDFGLLLGQEVDLTRCKKEVYNVKEQTQIAKDKPIVAKIASKMHECSNCKKLDACIDTGLEKAGITQRKLVDAAIRHFEACTE